MPLNGTLTCFLDPATSTVVGLGISSTSSPLTQKPQLCGKTASQESLPIPSPIVAVSVGIQKVGLGVSSLKFTTGGGGGDLFCGYQANTLKTFEATSSSNWGLSKGTLALIDAKCANVSGREVLTAGEIALTFTSSSAVGGSFPLYMGVSAPAAGAGGAVEIKTTEPTASPTPTPATTPAATATPSAPPPPSSSPASTPAATPGAPVPPPPSSPPSPPPSPSPSPPLSPSPSPPSSSAATAAVSWMESVVKPDPILAARVNATAVEGQAAVDVAPPMLGELFIFSLSFLSRGQVMRRELEKKNSFFFLSCPSYPVANQTTIKTGVGAASDHVIIGGKLPAPMPGQEAAAASAAVSDLPGAGVGILSGAGKAADANQTLSLVSGAGVSASGDGDGGNSSERQQLAEDGGSSGNPSSSDNSVISYASGEEEEIFLFFFFEVEVFFHGRRRRKNNSFSISPLSLSPPPLYLPSPANKQQQGTSGVSFTDSRAPTYLDDTKKVGQLYVCKAVSNGACSSWSFCTASLVGKSLLVTAAHCVFSYGKKTSGWPSYIGGQLQVYFFPQVRSKRSRGGRESSNEKRKRKSTRSLFPLVFLFSRFLLQPPQPQVNDNVGPYGSWAAQDVTIPFPYYNGSDTCAKNGPGIVCSNDLALVWLKPGGNTSPPQQAGERLGYNAYGFNNW